MTDAPWVVRGPIQHPVALLSSPRSTAQLSEEAKKRKHEDFREQLLELHFGFNLSAAPPPARGETRKCRRDGNL